MPQYCMDDESMTYTSSNGQSKDFVVYHKYHTIGSSFSFSYDYCLDGRKLIVCKLSERGALILQSEDLNVGFTIEVRTDIDSAEPTSGKVGDFLVVNVKYDLEATSSIREMRVLVTARTFESDLPYTEFYESIVLNDQLFEDVYSEDVTRYPNPHYKIYYNKEQGLIGFEDLEGELWTLDL